jgi:hypothetical protein
MSYYEIIAGTPIKLSGSLLFEGYADIFAHGSSTARIPVYCSTKKSGTKSAIFGTTSIDPVATKVHSLYGDVVVAPNPVRVTNGYFEDSKGNISNLYVTESYHLIVYDKNGNVVFEESVIVTPPTEASLDELDDAMAGIERFFARWTSVIT